MLSSSHAQEDPARQNRGAASANPDMGEISELLHDAGFMRHFQSLVGKNSKVVQLLQSRSKARTPHSSGESDRESPTQNNTRELQRRDIPARATSPQPARVSSPTNVPLGDLSENDMYVSRPLANSLTSNNLRRPRSMKARRRISVIRVLLHGHKKPLGHVPYDQTDTLLELRRTIIRRYKNNRSHPVILNAPAPPRYFFMISDTEYIDAAEEGDFLVAQFAPQLQICK